MLEFSCSSSHGRNLAAAALDLTSSHDHVSIQERGGDSMWKKRRWRQTSLCILYFSIRITDLPEGFLQFHWLWVGHWTPLTSKLSGKKYIWFFSFKCGRQKRKKSNKDTIMISSEQNLSQISSSFCINFMFLLCRELIKIC